MEKIINSLWTLLALVLLLSCSDFEEINEDPLAATTEQVQVEYFINHSIIGAQQDPHIAERAFVLYWKTAAHYQEDEGFSSGGHSDGWTSDYYRYVAGWLNGATTAIQVANEKIEAGNIEQYTNNMLQVARIWRAYLMSEMADNFGPVPITAFEGTNPEFASVKEVYYFMLEELSDASAKLDLSVVNPEGLEKKDPAYGYDYEKWQKYANSMRLRLAMRLSEVDPAKAQAEFEAAAAAPLITSLEEVFQVQEDDGWNDLAGVMSRSWNPQFLSPTLFNLYFGLGGILSEDQLDPSLHAAIKPADWMGLKFEDHFATKTNDPSAGYWFNGLPYSIDPRAYKAFIIPGAFDDPGFFNSGDAATTTVRSLMDNAGNVVKEIDATYTWNAGINGEWAEKGSMNQVSYYFAGTIPRMTQEFRTGDNQRIFFAPWETYFLLAEASVRGWSVPMTGKEAYETGIALSFEYWDVPAAGYLNSQEYNRVGTSVSWDHTAEPPASYTMNYKDGYTGDAGVATIEYPDNNLYMDGAVKNDHLTKIITQKFIAQFPYLPLEAWNDQRRLGLPFFDNPAVEKPIVNLPAITSSNFMTSEVEFFPQRLKYPSGLVNTNPSGYQQALSYLGGTDDIFTPLWWAKKQ